MSPFDTIADFADAPTPVAEPMKLTDAEILAVANELFPRWHEDIQERFVLMLADGWHKALARKAEEQQ